MIFNTHPINASLSPFIESLFHYKHFCPDHSIERVVPTGHVFLIFELDDMTRHTYDNESLEVKQTFTKVWISGMHRNYLSISAHENSEMLVIQFKAHGAYPFLHLPVQELTEKVLPAEEVFGEEILDLRERLFIAKESTDKFLLVEEWLESRKEESKKAPAELLDILQHLQTSPATQFAEVINSYPHSSKHLIDQFKKYLGLTPKYFQRILRFNEILQKIQLKENISWTEIAYSCGYADQSHFIKEFKHFSGFNPQAFIEGELNQGASNFFPLDRDG